MGAAGYAKLLLNSGLSGIELVVFRVNTGLGTKTFSHCSRIASQHIKVAHGWIELCIAIGIVVTGKDITGPSHIGSELIHFINIFNNWNRKGRITGSPGWIRLMRCCHIHSLYINASYPVALLFQTVNQVSADETTSATLMLFHDFIFLVF